MSKGFSIDLPNPSHLSEGVVRAAMPEATELIKGRAMKLAPRRSGGLQRSIEARVEQGGRQGAIAATARHSYIVHEGTTSHAIGVRKGRAEKKRALRLPGGILRAAASHPGTRGQPFLEQALEESKDDLARLFRQDGETFLRKVLR